MPTHRPNKMDNEDVGKPVSEYFGITGDAPKVLAYTGNDDAKNYILDGELTFDKIKAFGEDFLEGKLKPFLKSDPIPETNYAPWCSHCQALEPTYNKLAKHLHGIDSVVIAKMEHHRAKSDGFPTILFFPAGNKSSDPITVDDRTVVALYKFLKKNVSIPFKIQKPTSAPQTEKPTSEPKAEALDVKESHKSSSDRDLKDEL